MARKLTELPFENDQTEKSGHQMTKTGVRLVRHGRYTIFQMAEAAVPRRVFAAILSMINALRGPPPSGALA